MRVSVRLLSNSMKAASCAIYVRSFALCFALGCVSCLPALGDEAAFSTEATMTVTLPDVANVTYSVVSNTSTLATTTIGTENLVTGPVLLMERRNTVLWL
jgi:hypothetical protein